MKEIDFKSFFSIAATATDNSSGESIRDRQGALMKKKRTTERDIGEIPAIVNPARRAAALADYAVFKKTYFSKSFYRDDCPAMQVCNQKIVNAVNFGGKSSQGLPRGQGKSTNLRAAAIYAVCSGKRRFVVPVTNIISDCKRFLENIKTILETNELLYEDFPEILHPIRKLERITHRAKGQLCQGKHTRIIWSTYIQFPDIAGSPASSAVIWPISIIAIPRGLQIALPNGDVMRPDFLLIDDPQNNESAKSKEQTDDREESITGTLMGLAGQDQEIAAVMTLTIIKENDLADRFLSREKHPEWQGECHAMIIDWPDAEAMKLWEQYRNILLDELETNVNIVSAMDKHPAANAFYLEQQTAMDSGCRVMDSQLKYINEVSAIQHAMNLYLISPDTFLCEYQNAPARHNTALHTLTVRGIMERINGLPRRQAPENTVFQAACIDLNYYAASWSAAAFRNDFTPAILDYGFFPEGGQLYDTKNSEMDEATALIHGLNQLIPRIAAAFPELNALGIDGNRFSDPVYKWIVLNKRNYPFQIYAMRGVGSGQYKVPATSSKFAKLLGKPKSRCHIRTGRDAQREIWFDSHHWHLFMQRMWLMEPGAPRSISLFGEQGSNHRVYAEQICAERLADLWEDNGKMKYDWREDGHNEMSDIATMLCVLANCSGLEPDGLVAPKKQRKVVKMSELRKENREKRLNSRDEYYR